ncbi:MAG: site-specific integrase, partial [SAR324 cluster bacterium]|nr:site-specific integrase [SAR324 cluster bacterium]
MAAISKRISQEGKISFQAKIRLKGHPTQSATFSRLTDAKLWTQQTESAIREGRYFKTREALKHSLAELLDRYVREILPRKSPRDTNQARQIQWWKNRLGHLPIANVTPALVSESAEKLANGITHYKTPRSPATVNRYLAVLSHAFTIAVREWQWAEENPVLKVSKRTEPRGRVRYLDDDERERLLKACLESDQPLLYPAVVLSLATGARQGEIWPIKWKDVHIERGLITLYDTKNGEPRSVPLTGHALDVMRELRSKHATVFQWVFPGQSGRNHIDLHHPFRKDLAEAESENFRW